MSAVLIYFAAEVCNHACILWVCVLRHVLKRNPPYALVSDVHKNGRTHLFGVETDRLQVYLLETQEFYVPENTIQWFPLCRIKLKLIKYPSQHFSTHKTLSSTGVIYQNLCMNAHVKVSTITRTVLKISTWLMIWYLHV